MKLEEYRAELNKITSGEATGTAQSISVVAGCLAGQLETALWQPWAKEEAAELAREFRKVERSLEDLAIKGMNRRYDDAPRGTLAELLAS